MSHLKTKEVTIFLADDHNIVREGLKLLFDDSQYKIIGEAKDGEEAFYKIKELNPTVSLIDLRMPKMDGIELVKALRKLDIKTKIIILTVNTDEQFLVEVLKAGANGYVLKTVNKNNLFEILDKVLNGETYIDPGLASSALTAFIEEDSTEKLTNREIEILKMVANGYTNKLISQEFFISQDTVKEHVSNIIKKLGSKNRAEAVAVAIRKKLIK